MELLASASATIASVASAQVVAPAAAPSPVAPAACELHVFPAHTFISLNSGMLSGFGLVGAVADMAVHKDRAMTVRELLAEDLPADVQLAELQKVGMLTTLRFPTDTAVVIETPFPNPDELKANPSLKPKLKQTQADELAGKRLTGSAAGCYGELIVAYVMYQRAAMYGTRLFTFFELRDFRNGHGLPITSKGQVENHLPNYPPVSPAERDAARAALIDAFGADLTKWAQLKLTRG